MKAWLFLLGLLAGTASAEETKLRKDVETLSSEAFEGRGPGTKGIERAREYLEARFREAGLRPAGEGGFRQAFEGHVNLVGIAGKAEGERHVVLGAHYDHLGMEGGVLHPGADDNASGVAALLECARRLVAEAPARSVVVIAFDGEEEGLLGSAHYAEHPVLPLASCTAMVNLDTVGRLFEGSLTFFGAQTADEMTRVLEGVNYGFGFKLALPEKDPGGSDQKSFLARGVPALQVFTGANADYHRPSDTAGKVDFAGLERIAGFTTELVLYLAEREEPLTFLPPGAEKAAEAAPQGTARRVSFGSIPDFNHDGKGVLLSGVVPGSPAETAGLRTGDVIVVFAGVEVEDLKAFSDVLRGLSAGEEVEAVYLRDGERKAVTVTLVERK